MGKKRMTWDGQLVRITDKGAEAFRAGVPLLDNPYATGYRGHGTGPGGNLQAQRRKYWAIGWKAAAGEATRNMAHPAEHVGLEDFQDDDGAPLTQCVECGAVWKVVGTHDGCVYRLTKAGDGSCE